MKSAESKTTTAHLPQAQKASQPFFRKDGEGSFFAKEAPQQDFFFNKPPPEFSGQTIQAKLSIGAPGDKYEQEADAMAEKVVQRLAEGSNQLAVGCGQSAVDSPAVQLKCADCEKEDKLQKKEEDDLSENGLDIETMPAFDGGAEPPDDGIQAKSDTGATAASADLESRLNASKGGGQPLPEETGVAMGSAFGADFSGVRVHTGSEAVQMNKELGAQAFTHGSDVYFGAGKYDAGSREGQRLLGHELTHVVQQGGGNIIQRDCEPRQDAGRVRFIGCSRAQLDSIQLIDYCNVCLIPGAWIVPSAWYPVDGFVDCPNTNRWYKIRNGATATVRCTPTGYSIEDGGWSGMANHWVENNPNDDFNDELGAICPSPSNICSSGANPAPQGGAVQRKSVTNAILQMRAAGVGAANVELKKKNVDGMEGHGRMQRIDQGRFVPPLVQRSPATDAFDIALSAIVSPAKIPFKLAFAAIDLLPPDQRDAAIKELLTKSISLLKIVREPPEVLKLAITNLAPGPIDPTVVWPLMVSGLIGFLEHLNTLKGEDLYHKAEKAIMAQFEPTYFLGSISGTVQGVGNWFLDILELIKLLGEIYIYTTYPPLFVHTYSKEIQQAWEAAGVAAKWISDNKEALLELLKDKNALLAIKDSIKATVYLMAEELGKKAGQTMLKTIDAGPYAMGEAGGKIFGYVLPDIILAVGTDGLSELLKGGQAIFKAIKSAALGVKEIAYIIGLIEKGFASVKAMKIFAKGSKLSELGTKIMELLENLMKVFKAESLARKAKQEAELIAEAEKLGAAAIKASESKNKLSPVLSVVMDTESGKIFHGLNTPKSGVPHPDLHPILEQRRLKLPAMTESGAPGAHSEIQALNEALWHREARKHGVQEPKELIKLMKEGGFSPMVKESELSEFLLHNRNLKKIQGIPPLEGRPPRCLNCNPMTEGVTTVNIDEKIK